MPSVKRSLWEAISPGLANFRLLTMPVVGSSRKITLGSPIVLMTSESRRFIPPEYAFAGLSATLSSFTASNRFKSDLEDVLKETPFKPAYSSKCSRAVKSLNRTSN